MIKLLLLITLLLSNLYGVEIPTDTAKYHKFGQALTLNAQIVQLSNAKQNIMSMVGGHVEKYYIKPAQKVKRGDKIALIESMMLSQMSAEYVALKEQYKSLNDNYVSTQKLYDKGMTSQQELNNQSIQRDAMRSQINALRSQLETMGIKTKKLKKATSDYVLYAHSDGKVSAILQPLHSMIGVETPIVTIVNRSDSYVQSYLPLEYASKVKLGQKIIIKYGHQEIIGHVTQIMPKVDLATQRIILLSSIDDKKVELFINAYVEATLYFEATERYVAVKKSALSFFNNEWVVFLPNQEEAHDDHDEEHEEEADNDDEHDEVLYLPRVVEIISEDESYVAVKGIAIGEHYVSGKSYYVKSMILKSSLGEHGH